jgi:hypothetical protein
MIDAVLINNQVNAPGIAPFFEHTFFVEKNVDLRLTNRRFFSWILVYEIKVPVEIKDEATAVIERAFEENFGRGFGTSVKKLGKTGERKIRRHPGDAVDHTETNWYHGNRQDGGRKFFALFENKVECDRG